GRQVAKVSFCHPDERSEEGSPQSPDWWGDPSRHCRSAQDDKRGQRQRRATPPTFLEVPESGNP
ncbi:MAG: hypothetical protein AAF471_05510, partial [Myxococcota bacterium]